MRQTLNTKVDALANGVAHGQAVDDYTDTPPVIAVPGARYLIEGPTANGDWAGHEKEVAEWAPMSHGSSVYHWSYLIPAERDSHYVVSEDATYTFNGSDWVKTSTGSTSVSVGGIADMFVVGDIKQSILSDVEFSTVNGS